MPRNIEIKARVADIAELETRASAIAQSDPEDLLQTDTFFKCTEGRLKLREFHVGTAELIYYVRPDSPDPAESFYIRTPIRYPDALRESLSRAYGIIGVVRKRRTLYVRGRTRIHLDRVADLGSFLELEVVLGEQDSVHDGEVEMDEMMRLLRIGPDALVERAYIDLLKAQ